MPITPPTINLTPTGTDPLYYGETMVESAINGVLTALAGAVDTAIDSEATVRAAADTALDGRLDAVEANDWVTTARIDDGAVTLAKMADVAQGLLLGRQASAGTGAPQTISAAQGRAILNVADGSTANATDADLRDRTTHTGAQAISTVTGLQTALDAKAALTQLQTSNRLASLVVLEGVAGTGDAVTGAVSSSIYNWASQLDHPVLVKWPAFNTITTPTVAFAGVTYTITGPEGRVLAPGDLRAGAYYLIAPVSASGSTGVARIVNFDPHSYTRLETYGAVGNGINGDNASWAAAKALGREVELLHGRDYLVTDGGNPNGVPVRGQGRILTAVTGGTRQWNTYGDRWLSLGQEYLGAAKDRWLAGNYVNVRLFGDSTIQTVYGGLFIPTLIRNIMRASGLPVKQLESNATGGHSWGTQSLAPLVHSGAEVDHLVICKFGINDGATANVDLEAALDTLRDDMRTQLNAIRTLAASAGTVGNLSIIVMGPNTAQAQDSLAGYNEKFFERLRGVYVDAARRFQVAYFDTYAYLRDAYGSAGLWMDTARVHPLPNMSHTIWGGVFREMFPEAAMKFNQLQNVPPYERQPALANEVSTFPFGISTYEVTASGGGWPFDGILTVTRMVSGSGMQMLVETAAGGSPSATVTRATASAGGAWEAFR
jgi:hypothetical protein